MPTDETAENWLTLAEAAERLHRSDTTLTLWAREGRLEGRRGSWPGGTRWLVTEASVKTVEDELRAWVSLVDAAQIIGCSAQTVQRLLRAGHFEQRDVERSLPSLSRTSVESYAMVWRRRQQAAERARVERAERRSTDAPPNDGEVWLSVPQTAALMRLSTKRILQFIHEERIPAVQSGRRWWVRRDRAEQCAAARALRRSHARAT